MKASIKRYALVLALSSALPLMLNGCVTALVAGGTAATGAIIGSDSRTVDRQMYDEQIENDVNLILTNNRMRSDKKVFHVDAVAVNGNLLLVGQTLDSEYLNWCINQIKKDVKHLKAVYNHVERKSPVSSSVTANDALITSKVKGALLFGEHISSGRFKVITEDSVVYLLGFVTRDEANRAINQTRKVGGIKEVVHIFDYMDSGNSNGPVKVYNGHNETSSNSLNQSYSVTEDQGSVDNGGAVLLDDDSDLLAPAKVN